MDEVFNLSVVNIAPDTHVSQINNIAEIYGCGPGNLSIKLVDANGNIYWGCQAAWLPEHYAIFSDETLRAQMIPAELLPSLENLYERLVYNGIGRENFNEALLELGLTEVTE